MIVNPFCMHVYTIWLAWQGITAVYCIDVAFRPVQYSDVVLANTVGAKDAPQFAGLRADLQELHHVVVFFFKPCFGRRMHCLGTGKSQGVNSAVTVVW